MDRLTEKACGYHYLKECVGESCKETCERQEGKGIGTCDGCPIQKAIEKLAMYEDMEEFGAFNGRVYNYDRVIGRLEELFKHHAASKKVKELVMQAVQEGFEK